MLFLVAADTPREKNMSKIKRLLQDENGATAVEYGLIVAAIAAVIIVVVVSIGKKVKSGFDTVDSNMP